MQIDYLREFLLLEKTRNLGKAAKLLHISQSALSKHISALEDEVGLDLFKRVGKSLQLTEAGAVYRDGAAIIVNDVNSFTARMEAIRNRLDATIEVGYLPTVAGFLVGPLYDWFAKHVPSVQLRLLSMGVSDIETGLVEKQLVYAIALDFGTLDEQCSSLQLYEEEIFLVLSRQNQLATKEYITRSDLLSEVFLLPGGGFPELDRKLNAAFGMLPSYRNGTLHNDDVRTTLDLIAANRGIGFAGGHNRDSHPDLIFRRLDDLDSPITVPVCFFWQTKYETVRAIAPHISQLRAAFESICETEEFKSKAFLI